MSTIKSILILIIDLFLLSNNITSYINVIINVSIFKGGTEETIILNIQILCGRKKQL